MPVRHDKARTSLFLKNMVELPDAIGVFEMIDYVLGGHP